MTTLMPKQRKEKRSEEHDLVKDMETKNINYAIYNKVHNAVESFAGTSLGQFVTQKLDRILQLIEDIAKWSLPQSQEKSESSAPLNRPLPWIPFIAMILVLRLIRLSLSVGCLLIGNAPLVPGDVVYFIQTRRRKLRAIRIIGKRIIHEKEQASNIKKHSGLIFKLRTFLSVIVSQSSQKANKIAVDNKNKLEDTNNFDSKQSSEYSPEKWRAGSVSDEELTINELITKYGQLSNDSDSDFIPPNDVCKANLSSDTSATSTDDENHHAFEVPNTNLESVKNITNGSQGPCNSNESESKDTNATLKENGKQCIKNTVKPVPMPKKKDIVPIPIEEIKQEPEEEQNNSDASLIQSEQMELLNSVDNSEQPSIIEQINKSKIPCDEVTVNDNEIDRNESQKYASSKSGSPKLKESPEFQADQNWTAENSFREQANELLNQEEGQHVDKDHNYAQATPSIDHQQNKLSNRYSGKYNKNKFRGKPR